MSRGFGVLGFWGFGGPLDAGGGCSGGVAARAGTRQDDRHSGVEV